MDELSSGSQPQSLADFRVPWRKDWYDTQASKMSLQTLQINRRDLRGILRAESDGKQAMSSDQIADVKAAIAIINKEIGRRAHG